MTSERSIRAHATFDIIKIIYEKQRTWGGRGVGVEVAEGRRSDRNYTRFNISRLNVCARRRFRRFIISSSRSDYAAYRRRSPFRINIICIFCLFLFVAIYTYYIYFHFSHRFSIRAHVLYDLKYDAIILCDGFRIKKKKKIRINFINLILFFARRCEFFFLKIECCTMSVRNGQKNPILYPSLQLSSVLLLYYTYILCLKSFA